MSQPLQLNSPRILKPLARRLFLRGLSKSCISLIFLNPLVEKMNAPLPF
ncbi:MAG: hypothetical protein ACPL4E_06025 [Thermoproteota archaeon]